MRVLIVLLVLVAVPTVVWAQERASEPQGDVATPTIELQQTTRPAPAAVEAEAGAAEAGERPLVPARTAAEEDGAAQEGGPTTRAWWWLVAAVAAGVIIAAILL